LILYAIKLTYRKMPTYFVSNNTSLSNKLTNITNTTKITTNVQLSEKAYGGMEVWRHVFLTPALDRSE